MLRIKDKSIATFQTYSQGSSNSKAYERQIRTYPRRSLPGLLYYDSFRATFYRYGNRNITAGTGQTNLSFDASTNKITTSGYTYDSVGNTTADPSGMTFTYDAENKQTQVTSGEFAP